MPKRQTEQETVENLFEKYTYSYIEFMSQRLIVANIKSKSISIEFVL